MSHRITRIQQTIDSFAINFSKKIKTVSFNWIPNGVITWIRFVFSDYRANLELVIAELLEMLSLPEVHIDSDYMSDSEGAMAVMENNGKIAILVRKRLAPAIQQLIQHGLMVVGTTTFKKYFRLTL